MENYGGYGLSNFGMGGLGVEQFPDPFFDIGSQMLPGTMQRAQRWCEFIVMSDGVYCQALDRVASYFITDLDILNPEGAKTVGHDDKKKWLDFFDDTLKIKEQLRRIGLDFLIYGNAFVSLMMPFRRYLSCPGCKFEAPLRQIFSVSAYAFKWEGYQFKATCPHCQFSGPWKHNDRRSEESEKLQIKRWSPHEIEILHDIYSNQNSYIWRIPEMYRQSVRQGTLWHLERAPWEVICAIKDNEVLHFEDGYIYHMAEPAPAGFEFGGWGCSKVLSNFRQAYYNRVLHRYNEAIALDYVIPFRLITPAARAGGDQATSDPVANYNLGAFAGRVQQMLRKRRRDPAGWNVLPFPVEYQALGGDANQLAPVELLQLGMDVLLTSIGIPAEFFKGTLSTQAAGPALRSFEAMWTKYTSSLNNLLSFIADGAGKLLGWEPILAKLKRVTYADDQSRLALLLQMSANRLISQTAALSALGLDFPEEQRRLLEEQSFVQTTTQSMQEELESAQQAGNIPGGGQQQGQPQQGQQQATPPQGQQPDVPVSPRDLLLSSQQLATQLSSLPKLQAESELQALRKQDPVTYQLTRSELEKIRRQQAEQSAQAQAGAQGGQMPPQPSVQKAAEAIRLGRPLRRLIFTDD